MARRWGDLSERSRRLIIATAAGEAVLKTAMSVGRVTEFVLERRRLSEVFREALA